MRIFILFIYCALLSLSFISVAAENIESTSSLEQWGDWQEQVFAFDFYQLPLSKAQKKIIENKIKMLTNQYGVGIVGELEQAISELDYSSLSDEPEKNEQGLNNAVSTGAFHNSTQVEDEILSLEFALTNRDNQDPEQLNKQTSLSDQQFLLLLEQLEKITKKRMEKLND